MAETRAINYKAWPTAAKFHASNKMIRGLMGPVGNGKSVACVNEIHRLMVSQAPNCHGVRKTRGIIVRNTKPELLNTTLKTWRAWMPSEVCPIVENPIIRGVVSYKLRDGTTVEGEVIFLALDRPDDVSKVLSLDISWAWINEAREIPYAIPNEVRKRLGRYPAHVDGYYDTGHYKAPRNSDGQIEPCTRKAMILDTNPPDDEHWWYQLAEEGALRENRTPEEITNVARLFEFFRAPAPLIKKGNEYLPNPLAENIKYLPGGYKYYLDMIAGSTEDNINIMVMGNYGTMIDGRPVYSQYNDRMHCPADRLKLLEDLPIGLGWDFGLTPACVITQMTSLGQLRVVAELFSESMNVREFARDVVKPFLAANCKGIRIAFSVGDPAGAGRGQEEGKTALGILNDEFVDNSNNDVIEPLRMGFKTIGAPTNSPTRRIDAVSSFLMRLVDKGLPGFLISKSCTILRKAFLGAYCMKRVQVSGEARFKEKPDKNRYSHLSDALQYAALGWLGDDSGSDEDDYWEEPVRSNNRVMGY